MRVLVVTSCTGEKVVTHDDALTLADFEKGAKHVAHRERELATMLTAAEDLYSGLQHVRLMRGVHAFQEGNHNSPSRSSIDLWIVSAGYGVIPANRKIAPYECTFQGMKKAALRRWAATLHLPEEIRRLLADHYDLALVLLGDSYLEACAFDAEMHLGGPTLLFCGSRTAAHLPQLPQLRSVVLTNAEAKRFSCGLVGLKGELAARVLKRVAQEPKVLEQLQSPATDVLTLLEGKGGQIPASGKVVRINPKVDQVIRIPESWWHKPHREKLRYFIPEWDDLVDPDYDFATDTHSGGSGNWANEVYAHQMYPEPNYDGLLVSKVVAEKSKTKKERINALGVHRFLRVPRAFPIMGDCGAFGYIQQENPPYTTDEILDYYTRLDFDYGVSVDHLIVTATEAQKKHRYELTIHNAEEFLREHKKRKLQWEPIGSIQGWDQKSYTRAARQYIAMGYRYIALGGLVRTSTLEILRILEEVHQVVPDTVNVHLFGLARLRVLAEFARLGVRSVDSASYLRRAWMGSGGENYLTETGFFTAIRIPEAGKSFRAKRMVSEGRAVAAQVEKLEAACLKALRDFDAGKLPLEPTLDIIDEYDRLITPNRRDIRPFLRRTLEATPWKYCPCDICRRDGVEVIIFRGNNRNRRRGFHNIYVFYRLIQSILTGEGVGITLDGGDKKEEEQLQLSLFDLSVPWRRRVADAV